MSPTDHEQAVLAVLGRLSLDQLDTICNALRFNDRSDVEKRMIYRDLADLTRPGLLVWQAFIEKLAVSPSEQSDHLNRVRSAAKRLRNLLETDGPRNTTKIALFPTSAFDAPHFDFDAAISLLARIEHETGQAATQVLTKPPQGTKLTERVAIWEPVVWLFQELGSAGVSSDGPIFQVIKALHQVHNLPEPVGVSVKNVISQENKRRGYTAA
jgi:hypothetical protein